jgi:hypothetical protein
LYYDALLSKLCSAANVDIMYLGIGCSYQRHWELYMSHAAGPAHIKVPWWHAMTHGASCYLKNSGKHRSGALVGSRVAPRLQLDIVHVAACIVRAAHSKSTLAITAEALTCFCVSAGTGRRVGENCEQFWAMIKPFTSIARYMAKPHYLDFVEDGIFRIACGRQARFVELMQELDSSLRKKHGEWVAACITMHFAAGVALCHCCLSIILASLCCHAHRGVASAACCVLLFLCSQESATSASKSYKLVQQLLATRLNS